MQLCRCIQTLLSLRGAAVVKRQLRLCLQGSTAGMEMLAAAGAACSVKYLGRAGLQTLAGLNLAFLDGFFNPQKFGEAPDEAGTGHGCRYFTQVSTTEDSCCADCCAEATCTVLQGDWAGSATAQVPGVLV